jgi:molybdopterin-containing oxidoreductase family iron-sulfur binding subunit
MVGRLPTGAPGAPVEREWERQNMKSRGERTETQELSRRRFLQAVGAAGVASAMWGLGLAEADEGGPTATPGELGSATPVGAVSAAASIDETSVTRRWAFVVDLRLCDGCNGEAECTKACQQTHYLSPDQKWINVYQLTNAGGERYYMPRLCMHCENPPCEKVCPVGATFQNDQGVVLVDQQKCIGCRMCMAACPYEARYFNWSKPPEPPPELHHPMPEFPVPQRQGTVGKCILCVHYEQTGQLPACVEGCPMGALYIADLDADVATNGNDTVKLSTFLRENDAVRFKEELGTRPRVYYILGHGQNYTYQ